MANADGGSRTPPVAASARLVRPRFLKNGDPQLFLQRLSIFAPDRLATATGDLCGSQIHLINLTLGIRNRERLKAIPAWSMRFVDALPARHHESRHSVRKS